MSLSVRVHLFLSLCLCSGVCISVRTWSFQVASRSEYERELLSLSQRQIERRLSFVVLFFLLLACVCLISACDRHVRRDLVEELRAVKKSDRGLKEDLFKKLQVRRKTRQTDRSWLAHRTNSTCMQCTYRNVHISIRIGVYTWEDTHKSTSREALPRKEGCRPLHICVSGYTSADESRHIYSYRHSYTHGVDVSLSPGSEESPAQTLATWSHRYIYISMCLPTYVLTVKTEGVCIEEKWLQPYKIATGIVHTEMDWFRESLVDVCLERHGCLCIDVHVLWLERDAQSTCERLPLSTPFLSLSSFSVSSFLSRSRKGRELTTSQRCLLSLLISRRPSLSLSEYIYIYI